MLFLQHVIKQRRLSAFSKYQQVIIFMMHPVRAHISINTHQVRYEYLTRLRAKLGNGILHFAKLNILGKNVLETSPCD